MKRRGATNTPRSHTQDCQEHPRFVGRKSISLTDRRKMPANHPQTLRGWRLWAAGTQRACTSCVYRLPGAHAAFPRETADSVVLEGADVSEGLWWQGERGSAGGGPRDVQQLRRRRQQVAGAVPCSTSACSPPGCGMRQGRGKARMSKSLGCRQGRTQTSGPWTQDPRPPAAARACTAAGVSAVQIGRAHV